MNWILHHVSCTESTNTALKELAKQGAPEGYVLVADCQTGGRGRLGRGFFSPEGGLYTSFLVRPAFQVPAASLTCMTAVAAADAIESFGGSCTIKWVNDIFRNGRKAGGILVEGALLPSGLFEYAVVGIGLNLVLPDKIPEELLDVITSVFDGPMEKDLRETFLIRFLECFRLYYEALPAVTFREKYARLLNVYGRKVSFILNGSTYTGTAESIDEQFRLNVRTGTDVVALERGEVTFLR